MPATSKSARTLLIIACLLAAVGLEIAMLEQRAEPVEQPPLAVLLDDRPVRHHDAISWLMRG
jgi:hypothetical protein